MIKLLITTLILFTTNAALAEVNWLTDLDAAKAQGVKQEKPLLVVFTGSDWCSPCKALHNTVFSSSSFGRIAHKYVLVELDFPRTKPQSDEIKVKNRDLQRTFGVSGFPTVLLIDAKSGEVFGKTVGFGNKTAKEYLDELTKIKNTAKSRATMASEKNKMDAGADKFEEAALKRKAKLEAAIAEKNLDLSVKLVDEIFAGGGGKTNPLYWFNRADVLLKIDSSAQEEARKHLDMAANLAIKKDDKGLISFIENMRVKLKL
jgi:thioredoxin-related protein